MWILDPVLILEREQRIKILKLAAFMKVSEDMSHLNKKIHNYRTTSCDSKWYRSWWLAERFSANNVSSVTLHLIAPMNPGKRKPGPSLEDRGTMEGSSLPIWDCLQVSKCSGGNLPTTKPPKWDFLFLSISFSNNPPGHANCSLRLCPCLFHTSVKTK